MGPHYLVATGMASVSVSKHGNAVPESLGASIAFTREGLSRVQDNGRGHGQSGLYFPPRCPLVTGKRYSERHVCFPCNCSRSRSLSFPVRIPNNSFHPLTNVNCHPWFMFINQNGKYVWSAESGSRLLSESVINHYWLAFPVKLHENVVKTDAPVKLGKGAGAKRLAF